MQRIRYSQAKSTRLSAPKIVSPQRLIRALWDRVFFESCLKLLLIRRIDPDPKESVLLRFWLLVLLDAGEVDWVGT